ncbi:MAG: 2-succinyl-5-enolpyruvyl-6-hydroxy-3-cyclohexene-1-carboxylic-acid synthase [Prevotella sp.]|nr:2-succinyl-5-enolpyruvyl-6-hydroxy-3-cyclohexene-1-carboxylic-acid synthase [Prevotella sp.]
MYSSKENVNILTSLLVAHGIHHAVCCPGSRNSPIVHNLNVCPDIQCYPVTDERSAGFYALGMSQCLQEPVAVCVTSGTALLNLAPSVAEAYYQHIPLVVISADRPQAWIDQLDGQTLPQPDALGRFVRKAVSLPEPYDDETRWHCNRLVNEALIVKQAPVHINVPISEPLFDYSVSELPVERKIGLIESDASAITQSHVVRMFLQAKKPMLISGQPMNPNMDEAVYLIGDDERYVPDFVLYTGGSIVSKRLKRFLRKAKETWAVNRTGEINDTFQNLTHVIQGDGDVIADLIRFNLEQQPHPFVQQWDELLERVRSQAAAYEPDYSQMAAVKCFEAKVGHDRVHYANSTAIRLANIYAHHHVYCNRGVNGIDGSLSTAAGFSVVSHLSPLTSDLSKVFCVIGDLSFFYDQNALWNQNLKGNFRILLLNNGKGGIFNLLRGLEQSSARDKFVAAGHHTSAEGICMQNNVRYLEATNMEEMQQGIDTLLYLESDRPVLLEVFTDVAEDERVFKDYYKTLKL